VLLGMHGVQSHAVVVRLACECEQQDPVAGRVRVLGWPEPVRLHIVEHVRVLAAVVPGVEEPGDEIARLYEFPAAFTSLVSAVL